MTFKRHWKHDTVCIYVFLNYIISVQLFDSHWRSWLNKISKCSCITDFFVKKVPRQKLTQSIIVNVKTNIEGSNPDNEYFCSSNQIHHEYMHYDNQVSLFCIKLYVRQSQKLSNKEKIEYFQKNIYPRKHICIPNEWVQ